jgi:hypothetical protein
LHSHVYEVAEIFIYALRRKKEEEGEEQTIHISIKHIITAHAEIGNSIKQLRNNAFS